MEGLHVFVNFRLINLTISFSDELEKVSHADSIEAFVGIIEFSVVDCFDGGGDEIDGDAADVLEGLPVVQGVFIFSAELFTSSGGSSSRNVGICRRCCCRRSVGSSVACQEGGRVVEFTQVPLVHAP